MKTIAINGSSRTEVGKRATNALRNAGLVPCNLYGVEKEAKAFSVPTEGLRKLVYTPDIHVVDLTIDGKTVKAVMKDIQFHPVKDTILHVDFYQVTEEKPIVMAVPVKLEGLADGVRAGGKLVQIQRYLNALISFVLWLLAIQPCKEGICVAENCQALFLFHLRESVQMRQAPNSKDTRTKPLSTWGGHIESC